jgi:hypothetical protein
MWSFEYQPWWSRESVSEMLDYIDILTHMTAQEDFTVILYISQDINDVLSQFSAFRICYSLFQSTLSNDLQGDPVDCYPPIWLQFCSMAVDPPLTF